MLLSHLVDKGFAVGFLSNPQPPQPKAVVLVIRDAADNDLIRRVRSSRSLRSTSLRRAAGLDRVVENLVRRRRSEARPLVVREDATSFSPSRRSGGQPRSPRRLEGQVPSALKHPVYTPGKLEAGPVPIGRLFVDLSVLPALPPRAKELGLDGFAASRAAGDPGQGLRDHARGRRPAAQRGALASSTSRRSSPGTQVVTPEGSADYTLLRSIRASSPRPSGRWSRTTIPTPPRGWRRSLSAFRERTGLSLGTTCWRRSARGWP